MRIVGWIGSVIILVSAAAVGQTSAGSADLPALNHFDANVVNHNLDPCVDFYKFVCSNWQAANPIPSDQVVWGTASNLRLWNETVLRNTMEEASKPTPGRTAVQQKIGDYWYACMDEAAIEKSGLTPLQPQLDRIRGMKDKSEIAGGDPYEDAGLVERRRQRDTRTYAGIQLDYRLQQCAVNGGGSGPGWLRHER